eukprot:648597_1
MTYRDLSSYLSWFYRYFFLAIAHEHPNSSIHKVDKRPQSLYLISLPYLCTLPVNCTLNISNQRIHTHTKTYLIAVMNQMTTGPIFQIDPTARVP